MVIAFILVFDHDEASWKSVSFGNGCVSALKLPASRIQAQVSQRGRSSTYAQWCTEFSCCFFHMAGIWTYFSSCQVRMDFMLHLRGGAGC